MLNKNHIFKELRLSLRIFRRGMLGANLLVNIGFVSSIYINRASESFSLFYLFLGRAVITAVLIYLLYESIKKSFIYYYNIGLPKCKLITWQIVFDLIISLIIIVTSNAIIRG